MAITRDQLTVGAVLFRWHDTGCFGWKPYYCRVAAITTKTVLLVGENGDSKRKNIEWALRELSAPTRTDEIPAHLAEDPEESREPGR